MTETRDERYRRKMATVRARPRQATPAPKQATAEAFDLDLHSNQAICDKVLSELWGRDHVRGAVATSAQLRHVVRHATARALGTDHGVAVPTATPAPAQAAPAAAPSDGRLSREQFERDERQVDMHGSYEGYLDFLEFEAAGCVQRHPGVRPEPARPIARGLSREEFEADAKQVAIHGDYEGYLAFDEAEAAMGR